ALGRGQGPAQAQRVVALGRPTAAALHRPLPRDRAGGDPHGRAASALDPIATTRIEDLMHELKRDYTIVVVTHNMQQAARVADMTAFFSISRGEEGHRSGVLVEYDDTTTIFTQPKDSRTEDYVTGRFG